MTFGMIATWRMAYEAVQHHYDRLSTGEAAGDVLVEVIKTIEDYENFISVGYGGLPNENGIVQLDAAYMDGDTFEFGAVAGMEEIANPIAVARKLSEGRFNCMRVGEGAKQFALESGFQALDLLTEKSAELWKQRKEQVAAKELTAYDGHDTVGMVVLDSARRMVAGTSSSGLFMKKNGRVGDSPLAGSGLYVDSEVGGATATGLGEDLMKGVLSYETVRRMEAGETPAKAAQRALDDFQQKLKRKYGKVGAMSLICMNHRGEWGVATNVAFTFVVATQMQKPAIFMAKPDTNGNVLIERPTQVWLEDYLANLKYRTE